MTGKKEKIFVAMSGGVDSSVAAALLVKARYDVTGAFMINYDGLDSCHPREGGDPCRQQTNGLDSRLHGNDKLNIDQKKCWTADYRDALRVAAKLGIPLLKFDFTKEYKKLVLDYMFKEYEAGRTPNPDVLCNKFVKFGVWLDKANELGFDKMATGHYARLVSRRSLPLLGGEHKRGYSTARNLYPAPRPSPHRHEAGSRLGGDKWRWERPPVSLTSSKDLDKDQTYFLHQLSQEQLSSVLFPIGDYTKKEVRALAKKFNLPTAEKEESMGICFVGEVPMKDFLMTKIRPKQGDIVFSSGKVAGKHDGLAFYTIGQRIGLEIENCPDGKVGIPTSRREKLEIKDKHNTKPFFVIDKNINKNLLIVGFNDDPLLYKKEIEVTDVNWVSGRPPQFPLQCEVRLRHGQPLQRCLINNNAAAIHKLSLQVKFTKPQRAVTPGQFAVFYKKLECLGGGVVV